jgi:hypothetical protein
LVEAALFALYYNRREQAKEHRSKSRQKKYEVLQRRYRKKYGDSGNEKVPETEIKSQLEEPSLEGETNIRRRQPLERAPDAIDDS